MTTTTTARTTATVRWLLTAAVLAASLVASPALALDLTAGQPPEPPQPPALDLPLANPETGDDDPDDDDPDPDPQDDPKFLPPGGEPGTPSVHVDVAPRCDPDPGFTYQTTVTNPPPGQLAPIVEYREPGGPVQSVGGPDGAVTAAEGTYEVRAVLHHQGQGFYASAWADVTVDCPVVPDPDDPDEGDPDDDIVVATPNFTG
jgi:hypothetical protein